MHLPQRLHQISSAHCLGKSKNLWLAGVLIYCFTLSASFAGEGVETSIDYANVNDLLNTVGEKAHSQYVYAESSLSLKNPNIEFSDVRLWLQRGENSIWDIVVGDEGKIILPIIPPNEMDGVRMYVNQAKNATALSINFGIRPPTEKTMSYKSLFVVLQDVNGFSKELAGVVSWFIRDYASLKLKFDRPASVEIKAAKKTYRYETDDDLVITIKRKRRLMKEDPELVFSSLPIGVGV